MTAVTETVQPNDNLLTKVEASRASTHIGPYPIPSFTETVKPLADRHFRATTYQSDFPNWWRGKTVCRSELWRRNGSMPSWNFLRWITEIPKRSDADETIYQTEFCNQQELSALREMRRQNHIDVINSPEVKDGNSLFYTSVYNLDYKPYPKEICFPSRPLEAPRQLHLSTRPLQSLPYPTPGLAAFKEHYETCTDRAEFSRYTKLPPLVSSNTSS